jgi:hypothetical protein
METAIFILCIVGAIFVIAGMVAIMTTTLVDDDDFMGRK